MSLQGSLVPELERMRNLCYQEGKDFLEDHPDSRQVLERLQEECPHVPVRELVLLFHLRDDELVKATAHRLEYNATHPVQKPDDTDEDR